MPEAVDGIMPLKFVKGMACPYMRISVIGVFDRGTMRQIMQMRMRTMFGGNNRLVGLGHFMSGQAEW